MHSKVLVDDISPRIKTFYAYSLGEQIIEIVRMNFETNHYSKLVLYADKPIEDFKISSDRLKDWQTLSVLGKKDGTLFLQIQELRNFRKASSVLYKVASEVEKAWLALGVYKDIYTLSRNGNKMELVKIVFNQKIIERKSLVNFDVGSKDNFGYDLLCCNEMVNRYKPVVVLVTINKNSSLYYLMNTDVKKYSLQHPASLNTFIRYSFNVSNDEFTFFYDDYKNKKIRSLVFHGSKQKLVDEELIESENIDNYLVASLSRGRIFLISTNSLQNSLSFEKL